MLRGTLLEYGYKENEIVKILKTYPINNCKEENILQNIKMIFNFFLDFGYPKKDIIKMSIFLPAILSYSIENIKEKINFLKELGYSKNDIFKMTKSFPLLYGYSSLSINQKISSLEELGYSREEVIHMLQSFSALFGLAINNIKIKINFLKHIGLDFLILDDPQKLITSVDLVYARYNFFIKQNIEINQKNYLFLFKGTSAFEKQYEISKEELIEEI